MSSQVRASARLMHGMGAAAVMSVALLTGCCDRFSRTKIEEGARGDEAASRVAWTLRLSDAVNYEQYSVTSTSSGDVVFAGTLHADVEIGRSDLPDLGAKDGRSSSGDVVVWKLSAAGKPLWAQRFGSNAGESASSVAVDGGGNVFVGGWFHRSMQWGPNKWDANADVRGGFVGALGRSGKPGWGAWFDATPVKLEHEDATFPFGAGVASVVVDAVGRLYVLGSYTGKLRMNGKQLVEDDPSRVGGVFLARFDPGGALHWYKMGSYPEQVKTKKDAPAAPPTFTLYGDDLCTTEQGLVVVAGTSQGDGEFAGATFKSTGDRSLFVSVRNDRGTHIWTDQFAVKGELWSPRVVVMHDGSLLVAGATNGEVTLGETTVKADAAPGSVEAANLGVFFAARIDPEGKVEWAKRLGTVVTATPVGLSADPAGGFVVSASLMLAPGVSTDMGGGPLFDKELPGRLGAIAVASYANDGAHRWSRGFTTEEHNSAGALTVTPKGRAVVVGTVNRGDCLLSCETKQLGDVFMAALGK